MYMYVICKYIGPILVNFKPEKRSIIYESIKNIHPKLFFSKIIKKNIKVALRAKRNETVIIIGGQCFLIRWLEIFYFYQTLIGLLKFSTDDFYPLNTLHGM